jgi:hypothetical protein
MSIARQEKGQMITVKEDSMKHETVYYVFRYNLRPEAGAEYKQWLVDHSNGRSQQTGWTYVGTFCDVMGLGRYDYETRWELNNHGSVNTRPLDAETERRMQERLPFIEDGQVAMMKAVGGIASYAH